MTPRAWREAIGGVLAGLVVVAGALGGAAPNLPPPQVCAVPLHPAALPPEPQARAAAVQRLQALVDSIPPYPGSRALPPTAAGPDVFPPLISPYAVALQRRWSVPAEPAAVLAWTDRWARGAGFSVLGSVKGNVPANAAYVRGAPTAGAPVVVVSVQQGILRYDAWVIFLPPRPAGEFLPSGARSVTVATCNGFTAHLIAYHVFRRPAVITALTSAVNALPRDAYRIRYCSADGGLRLALRFRYSAATIAVVLDPACGTIVFGPPGRYPGLVDDQRLIPALQALGVPSWEPQAARQAPAS